MTSTSILWDTLGGLIPVKILSVTPDRGTALVQVTGTRGAWKKGDLDTAPRRGLVPKSAVHTRGGTYRIWAHESPLDSFHGMVEDEYAMQARMRGKRNPSGNPVSYYVKRARREDGYEAWTGPIRSATRAEREREAWEKAGWAAVIYPGSPAVRAHVNSWKARVKAGQGADASLWKARDAAAKKNPRRNPSAAVHTTRLQWTQKSLAELLSIAERALARGDRAAYADHYGALREVSAQMRQDAGDAGLGKEALPHQARVVAVLHQLYDGLKARSNPAKKGSRRPAKKRNPAFKEGDLVRYKAAFLRSIGMYSGGPIDGVVVAIAKGLNFPVVAWSNGRVSPVNPANLEHKKSTSWTPGLAGAAVREGKAKYEAQVAREAAEEAAFWASPEGQAAKAKHAKGDPRAR